MLDRAKYLNSLPVLCGINYRFTFKGKQRKAVTHRVTVKHTAPSPRRHCINNNLIEVQLRYETTNTYQAHYQVNVNWTMYASVNESGAVVEGHWWGKVILSNTNPTRTGLRSDPTLCGEKTETNHCTATSTLF